MTRRGLRDVDRKPPLDLATGRMKCVLCVCVCVRWGDRKGLR